MYSQDRDHYRRTFYETWEKYQKGLPLTDLEKKISAVILAHPEYLVFLNQEKNRLQDFALEENPFFHMSLHLALQEQIAIDKPAEIKKIFADLQTQFACPHKTEHMMMQCLFDQLKNNHSDEKHYLDALKSLVNPS